MKNIIAYKLSSTLNLTKWMKCYEIKQMSINMKNTTQRIKNNNYV